MRNSKTFVASIDLDQNAQNVQSGPGSKLSDKK